MQDHINCETQKTSAPSLDQHLPMLAKNHAHTRNGNIPGDVDAMGQQWLENDDALFWVNPLVLSRSPTHQRHNVFKISDTREDMTTTTTRTHSKEHLANLGTTPSVCRTRNNRNPKEAKAPTKSQSQKKPTNPYHKHL